ncbi:hypothetical protein SETIT_6G141200v2 [Setaria italica]|uniref:GRF-type domain-containing protein n=1 Tax=Setaria italica TaxID=4555 RepID=A0A368RN24_SETIT|nr:hypothetical protein SETIT_6G141200v2 [Setaria italica]
MARAASGSSSWSSASSVPDAGDDGICWSPVAYREGPLDYEPAVNCRCRKKAARWISWSILNPGRRYFTCMTCRAGGCEFWKWYDDDNTSPFVKQLAHYEEMLFQRVEGTDWRRTVAEKQELN